MKRLLEAFYVVLVVAVAILLAAATPQHPKHEVLLDNLSTGGGVEGQIATIVGGKWRPAGGTTTTMVYNVSLNPALGGLRLTRDASTGTVTLPSIPNPPEALDLHVNGLHYIPGIDFTISGAVATPSAEQRDVFLNATEITAAYPR